MTSDMEKKEWLDDYLSLKQVNPNNPFTVPAGYFDELGERIISGIKLDEIKNTTPLDNCFTVPENYFEELGNNIKSRITVESVLNTEEKTLNVPENYFEELSAKIQSRVTVETFLNTENTGFAVPENYFENLNNQINSRLFVEEALNNTSEPFTVPQDYFNDLSKSILNQTVNQQPVKHKGAVIRLLTSGAFKYATAACFALIIGGAVFMRQAAVPTVAHNATYLHQELSTVPVDEIQSYVQLNVDANDAQHTVAAEDLKVNDDDLNAALQDYSDNNQ